MKILTHHHLVMKLRMFGTSVTCMILTDWSINKNNFTALVRSSDYGTRTERNVQFN
jgi:hypothetical protein